MSGEVVTTPAEQEAERRYRRLQHGFEFKGVTVEFAAFVAGWNECESRFRVLLEAAREYRDGKVGSLDRLLAAAAALEETA